MAHVTLYSALSILVNPVQHPPFGSDLCRGKTPLYLREPHTLPTTDHRNEETRILSELKWPLTDNLEYLKVWREKFSQARTSKTPGDAAQGSRPPPVPSQGNDRVQTWKHTPNDPYQYVEVDDIVIAFGIGDRQYNNTLRLADELNMMKLSLPRDSAAYIHQRLFRRTNPKTRLLSHLGFIMDYTTMALMERISRSQPVARQVTALELQTLGEQEVCEVRKPEPAPGPCDPSARYRTIDGTCNNLQNPDWGATFTPFRRAVPPDYGDGVSSLRLASDGKPLPSARLVSTTINPTEKSDATCFNFLHLSFGQFVDHDLTNTPVTKGANDSTLPCCIKEVKDNPALRHPECAPISIPVNDRFYATYAETCMEFARSVPAQRCSLGPREQVNQITAYLDGSNVYGSTEEEAERLRERKGGRLLVMNRNGEILLPPSLDPDDGCNREERIEQGEFCFISGDDRVNEQVVLTLMHTIWTREHNRVAEALEALNPKWPDEVLFQEARRIVVAEMQQIVYNEFLPGVLGKTLVEKLDLLPQKDGRQTSVYDPTVNAQMANEFSTAAYRFGHSMIPNRVEELNKEGKTSASELNDVLFKPFTLYAQGSTERLVRGTNSQNVLEVDPLFSQQITDKLFREEVQFGLDLVSLNLQRGRDHGIGSYLAMREACGLPRINSFAELEPFLQPGALTRLQKVYRRVADIDLFAGGISERAIGGGQVGATFSCLIADQFKRLKIGDRFYFEERNGPGAFTRDQLRQIHGVSMARILCDNVNGIHKISRWPLQVPSAFNPQLPCDSNCIPSIDFTVFRGDHRADTVASSKK